MTFDYNCLMVNFNIPNWSDWLMDIDQNDLHVGDDRPGFEYNPHCTILYGFLPRVRHELIQRYCPDLSMFKFKIVKMDIFDNENCDVLIYRLENQEANKLNRTLKMNFPCDIQYTKYEPHMTIGYFKKGKASKYIKETSEFNHYIIPVEYCYSYSSGKKVIWK